MSEKKSIPTSKLIPVAAACGIVAVAALLGVPEIILIPMAAITVVWIGVVIAGHYLNSGKKRGDA